MIDLNFSTKKFTPNHEKIANYIMKEIDKIPFMVESDLAKACNVSISTVSRFWETIEFKNFKQFKQFLMQENTFSPAEKLKSAFNKLEAENVSNNILSGTAFLKETADNIDNVKFNEMIQILNSCNTIHIYGYGPSVCLVSLLEFRLKRFDFNINVLTQSGHELFEDLIHIKKDDVIFIFGFVYESPEIKVLLDLADKLQCKTILISDLLISPMLEKATFSFYTSRGELWEFHSMLAPLALVENIIVSVGKKREKKSLDKLNELYKLRHEYEKILPKVIK
ncbi:MurR/RpiR family transcriptional regulator [Clostridium hydrogenum]|uniref:MurR/RpiR family transcriptional regulator n=1 Tax=Clostridium hydrogenum TaxID=2855764 RepID=UPI001F163D8C|nr:MurR/RpiR family transcriptional regulator [Clostridium hydrogenum]